MDERSWEQVAVPIMEAALAAERSGGRINASDLRQRFAVPDRMFDNVLRDLISDGYIGGRKYREGGDFKQQLDNISLRPAGRRAVGDWPTGDLVGALVRSLEARIDAAEDPAEKGKLKTLLSNVGDVGKDVLTGVLTAVVKEQAGLA